jgi:Tol biopolymer transport system component
MGEVYRARDPRLGRDVAVKVVSSDAQGDPERLHRFEDEARAAGALNHPNLLAVFDTGRHEGAPYVVFELLEGETLRHRLLRGPLPPRKVLEYGGQVCQGLAAAHGRGIVHRDLKPENLFITTDGLVKILDFGLAKLTQPDGDPSDAVSRTDTRPGLLLGTIAYMSPEQARGEAADERSDIFAFGATLYEMLSGRPAFARRSAAETVSAILNHDPEAIGNSSSGPVGTAIEQTIRRCLEKDPEERFQSARDLGFALSALASEAPTPVAPKGKLSRTSWTLVAGVLVAGVVAGAYLLRARRETPLPPMSVAPLTAFPGQEIAPTFSPDGSQVAFAWSPEGLEDRFDLYVKVLGSEKLLRLTTHPAEWISPAWSPDGRSIAFARMAHEGTGIYLIPALGGRERKLVGVEFNYYQQTPLSWSPDGKLLAYTDLRDGVAVSLLDVATGRSRRLSDPSPDCPLSWIPAFSPDAASVAVACFVSNAVCDLFVVPVAGGPARRVGRELGDVEGLVWAADGKSLVFTSYGKGLARVAAVGGRPEPLPFGPNASFPAISRDGHRLAYTDQILNANIWQVPLVTPTRTAGPPAKLVSSSRLQENPAFSPDGQRLVFESTRSGAQEIWISNADGSDPVAVTSFNGPSTGSPRWSPDGRWVAFDSRSEGKARLYLVGSEGGTPRVVATGQPDSSVPAWSPDGRWLYFSAEVGAAEQVFRIRPEGGPATQITRQGGSSPYVSPDGQRVYYITERPDEIALWSASADGRDERRVPGMPGLRADFWLAWTIVASGIYFVNPERGALPGVDFFDFATGRIHRVVDLTGRPAAGFGGRPAVSPDGRSLLFTQIDEVKSDLMLVENFR